MYRKVTFYTTADGKCPVAEFIDSQTPKVAQKIAWVLKAVQEIEKVPNAGILSQRKYCNSYKWFPKKDSENTEI